jgi:peptide methionine sulfoxide reductase MsrB
MTATPAVLRWNDVLAIARKGNPPPPRRVEKPASEWRQVLDPQTFHVAREKGTERPHSAEKFQSGTGWPSFTQAVAPDVIAYHEDLSYGRRIEVTCNICDAHLGHVFQDGPPPSGLRYCINALSLQKVKT